MACNSPPWHGASVEGRAANDPEQDVIVPSRKKMSTYAVIALLAAIALPMPSGGGEAASVPGGLQMHRIAFFDVYDDGLTFSNDDSIVLLLNHSRHADNSDLLRFEIDACGELQGVERRRSMIRRSALDDHMNLNDDVDDDPSDLGFELIEHWLAAHPEIAVMTDGIDKSCDRPWIDEDFPPKSIARWRARPLREGDARLIRPQLIVMA
jgi:hypothetical protein